MLRITRLIGSLSTAGRFLSGSKMPSLEYLSIGVCIQFLHGLLQMLILAFMQNIQNGIGGELTMAVLPESFSGNTTIICMVRILCIRILLLILKLSILILTNGLIYLKELVLNMWC